MKFNPFKDGFKNKVKEVLHPKNIWKQAKEHKTWAITGIAGVVTTSVVVPTAVILTQEKIEFDGQTFKSQSELANYLKDNYLIKTINKDNAFSLELGDEKRYFSSVNEVYDFLSQNNIKNDQFYSSPSMYGNSFSNEVTNYPLTNNPDFIKRVYRGNNNSFFIDGKLGGLDAKEEAIKSYLQLHQLYYFNGQFFKNQSDLKLYLADQAFKNISDQRILISSDNSWSLPVVQSNANDDFLKNFLISNSKLKVDFQDGFGSHTIDELKQRPELIDDRMVPYVQIHASQGSSRYFTDITSSTPGSLYSPTLYDSPADSRSMITNHSNWQKIDFNLPREQMISNQNTQIMNSLTNFAFNDNEISNIFYFVDNPLNDIEFLNRFANEQNNFISLKDDLNKILVLNESNQYVSLDSLALSVQKEMMRAKRYSAFESIPTLRTFLINQIIKNNGSSFVVNKLSLYFDYLTRIMGYRLEKMLDPFLSDEAKNFNFGKIFGFKDSQVFDVMPQTYTNYIIDGKVESKIGNGMFEDIPEATEIFLSGLSFLSFQATIGLQTDAISKTYNEFEYVNNRDGTVSRIHKGGSVKYDLPRTLKTLLTNQDPKDALGMINVFLKSYDDFASNANQPTFSRWQFDSFADRVSLFLTTQYKLFEKVNRVIDNKLNSWDIKALQANLVGNTYISDISNELQNEDLGLNNQAFDALSIASSVTSIINSYISVNNSFVDAIEKILKISSGNWLSPLITGIFSYIGVALEVFSAIQGKVVQDSFMFSDAANKQFIWTGGQHTDHSFFGIHIATTNVVGPEAMDIIKPIKIMNDYNSNGYYFDKKIYSSLLEVKKDWIANMNKNNLSNLANVSLSYEITLKTSNDNQNFSTRTFSAQNIDDLITQVLGCNEAFHAFYINEAGITTNFDAQKDIAMTEALAQIRPLWVMQLPKVENNILVTYPYMMPNLPNVEIYHSKGLVNNLNYDYWFISPNVLEDSKLPNVIADSAIRTYDDALKVFINKFNDNFLIESKLATIYDATIKDTYEEIAQVELDQDGNALLKTFYIAHAPSGESRYFDNEGSALGWLCGETYLTRIELLDDLKIYGYNDHEYEDLELFARAVITGRIYE